jgi:translation initiation factor IF-1
MRGTSTILVEARVTGRRSGRAFDLILENGHRFVGFVKKVDIEKKSVEIDQRVKVKLTSFDLSKGQIVFEV